MPHKILAILLQPQATALALLLLAWLAARLRRRASACLLAVGGWTWLLLCALPVFSNVLVGAVQVGSPLTPPAAYPAAPVAVVLGGGVAPAQQAGAAPHLKDGADRVWLAARLYHAGRAPLLLLAGGSDRAISVESEAQAMRRVLLDFGVPDAAMLLENQSRTTAQNAADAAPLLRARGVHRILLVTSALHMRRAAALFRAQGFDVVEAPTDFRDLKWSGVETWLPQASALRDSGQAITETVGWLIGPR